MANYFQILNKDSVPIFVISFDSEAASSDSDDRPCEITSPPVTFSENKENTPIFEQPIKGYTSHQLLDIIVGKWVRNGNICKQLSRAVRTHAAYVVDTEAIGSSHIVAFGAVTQNHIGNIVFLRLEGKPAASSSCTVFF